MAKLGQAQEPSMEEILASIRRIISDDDRKAEAGGAPPAPPKLAVVESARPEPAPPPDATAKAPELPRSTLAPSPASAAGPTPAEAPEAAPPSAASGPAEPEHEILELSEADATPPDDELEAIDVAFVEPAAREEPAAAPRPQPAAPASPAAPMIGGHPGDRRLLSERTDEAVNTAFNQLAATFLTNQARTLEDIVKEMMRPMLKSWLDDNLPPLVERLVREEIERVSRGRR